MNNIYLRIGLATSLFFLHGGKLGICQEYFDSGMLACVVQIQRLNPREVASTDDGIKAISYSSGFLVRGPLENGSRVFLITAAHNVVDCADIQVEFSAISLPNTPSQSLFQEEGANLLAGRIVKPFVYFDCVEDIAVFELEKDFADALIESSSKIVGSLLDVPKQSPASARLPRGAIASAAGTVQQDTKTFQQGTEKIQYDISTIHPAYSCTLSRYIKGWSFVDKVLDRRFASDVAANGSEKEYAEAIRSRVGEQQFLIVESMSIRSGFSGSPVMISRDHFIESGEIVGMILGGKPNAEAGREAWATPAETLKVAIRTLTLAIDKKLAWINMSKVASENVLCDPACPGRCIFDTSLRRVTEVLKEKFSSPYRSRFTIESRIEFRSVRKDGRLCGNELKARIERLPGRSFDFTGMEFDANCLNNVNLLTPGFYNCTFRQTAFNGSVLTGPTFFDCKFVDHEGRTLNFSDIIKPPCTACSPAALVAPIFKETGTLKSYQTGLRNSNL